MELSARAGSDFRVMAADVEWARRCVWKGELQGSADGVR